MEKMRQLNQTVVEGVIRSTSRLLDQENVLLTINWLLRMAAAVGLTAFFVQNKSHFSALDLSMIRAALFLYYGYGVLSGFLGIFNGRLFLMSSIKAAQAVVEIGFYSIFYYLTGDFRSEFYLLYFIPLLITLRFVDPWWWAGAIILGCVGANYTVMATLRHVESAAAADVLLSGGFASVLWMRSLFLVIIPLAYHIIRRRASLPEELQEEGAELAAMFQSMEDGVYAVNGDGQLLFANATLQARHGAFKAGQACTSFLRCSEQFCMLATGEPFSPGEGVKREAGQFVDGDGNRYPVEVTMFPLKNAANEPDGMVAFVKDVNKQKAMQGEVERRLMQSKERERRLISQRMLWQETFVQMSQRLARFEEPDKLMHFVVDQTLQRLQAESCALFLADGQVLRRKAIAPMEDDWLANEAYGFGEGITGQVVVPAEGSKYGGPQRRNRVEDDPDVVPPFLSAYQQRLPSHTVGHLMAVPLNGELGSFGALRVVNKIDAQKNLDPTGFTPDDQDFLVTIAAMVQIALENSRLLVEAQKGYQQVSTLYEVSQHMTQAGTLTELLQLVVDESRRAIPAAAKASVHLIDKGRGALVLEASSEAEPYSSGLPPMSSDSGIAGNAIRTRAMVYSPDTLNSPDFIYRGVSSLRSLAVAPLIASSEEKVLGTLSLDSPLPNAFSPEDLKLFELLAAQAAGAIGRVRLLDEEQKRRKQADMLLEVSNKVNEKLKVKGLWDEIMNALDEVIDYRSASIHILEDQYFRVVACRGFGIKDRKVIGLRFPINDDKFPNFHVYHNRAPLIVADTRASYPHFFLEDAKYHSRNIRSWMGIPLMHRGRIIGMISLDQETPGYFNEEMQALALTFANQMAVAMANGTLFRETKQQLSDIKMLLQASQAISETVQMEEVLQNIVDYARQISSSDHAGVVLVEGDRTMRSIETRKIGAALHERVRPGGVTSQIIRDPGRPHIFNRVAEGDRRHNPTILKAGFHSYAGFPIVATGTLLGVLFVHSYKADAYRDPRLVSILQTLATHAATGIENSRLYQKLDLQARKEALTSLGYDLHDISNLIHGALVLRLGVTKEKLDRKNYTGALNEIETMRKAALTVHSLLHWIVTDLRRDGLFQEKGLAGALKHVAELLHLELEMESSGEKSLPLEKEYALYKIGLEALNNVAKHGGDTRHSRIRFDRTESEYIFEVSDFGVGFDQEEVKRRPDKFGLDGMQRWADSIEAKFELKSGQMQGTTIRVIGQDI